MNVLLFPLIRCLLISANCSSDCSMDAVLKAPDSHHKLWVSKCSSDLNSLHFDCCKLGKIVKGGVFRRSIANV